MCVCVCVCVNMCGCIHMCSCMHMCVSVYVPISTHFLQISFHPLLFLSPFLYENASRLCTCHTCCFDLCPGMTCMTNRTLSTKFHIGEHVQVKCMQRLSVVLRMAWWMNMVLYGCVDSWIPFCFLTKEVFLSLKGCD